MRMLARAQSLSGRPLDALVMLERLLGAGRRRRDAATSDDFRRVRALPGWADFEQRARGAERRPPRIRAERRRPHQRRVLPAAAPAPARQSTATAARAAMPRAGVRGSRLLAPTRRRRRCGRGAPLHDARVHAGRPRLRSRVQPLHRRRPRRPQAHGSGRSVAAGREPRRRGIGRLRHHRARSRLTRTKATSGS